MLQTSVEMVNPGGTGRPALVISARPAPLPPRRSFMVRWPSAFPFAKKYTYFRDLGFGIRDLAVGIRDLAVGIRDLLPVRALGRFAIQLTPSNNAPRNSPPRRTRRTRGGLYLSIETCR